MSNAKILHISNYYYPHIGGVEKTAYDIATALKSENVEQIVICFNDTSKTIKEVYEGVNVVRVGKQMELFSQPIALNYYNQLKKIIKEFKPNIIHFHYPNPLALTFLKKYIKGDIKLIVHWHSDIVKQKLIKKLFVRQTKFLLNKADKIICTSPIYAENSEFVKHYLDKCEIISSCVNEDELDYLKNKENKANEIKKRYKNKKLAIFFGRHSKYKGLNYLIEAGKHLDDNIQILIGGKGRLTKTLKKQAKNLNNIEFIGEKTREEMINYIYASDLFVFPSITKNEAFGLSLAEALYLTKPAITFSIEGSGVNYVSIDGVTGIECENGNFLKLAEAINKLAKDDELRKEYGENARKRVLELFTNKIFKEKIKQMYEVLINDN